ncbi:MOSC domain-containing protein [Sphingomonas sp. PR090111-T3T-6A]|uniref:MOSC domain-containing protein n=1 Tax=Sphingomonas sp. PR090111-T3T-6A TaxID=685778 RepID=UPI000367802A|nr:MOSC domain-containing protein [Sphingomonas sp. PR090111-T3T-6A]
MMNLHSVQVGRAAPLGPENVPSGFVKRAVSGRIPVAALGLTGDEQADLTVHGGPEKAVYGYAARHYASWQAEFPEHAARLTPGGFGENLTIEGLDEDAICVGDIHRIGSAVLQVCQPRQPCFKLALRFEDNRLPKAMVRTGRAGWYYRVLEEGELGAGDAVTLVERPQPAFRFSRLVTIVNHGAATPAEMAALAEMPELASSLRRRAQGRWKMIA